MMLDALQCATFPLDKADIWCLLIGRVCSFDHFILCADSLNSTAFTPVKMDIDGNIKVRS